MRSALCNHFFSLTPSFIRPATFDEGKNRSHFLENEIVSLREGRRDVHARRPSRTKVTKV